MCLQWFHLSVCVVLSIPSSSPRTLSKTLQHHATRHLILLCPSHSPPSVLTLILISCSYSGISKNSFLTTPSASMRIRHAFAWGIERVSGREAWNRSGRTCGTCHSSAAARRSARAITFIEYTPPASMTSMCPAGLTQRELSLRAGSGLYHGA